MVREIPERSRGVALITAVMFAMVIGVIARGMLALNATDKSKYSATSKRARQAAGTGLEYARSQLALNSQWRGNSSVARVIDTESLKVEERDGNVFGRIIYPDGSQAQFRIQFNCQDGPGGLDGLKDPASEHQIRGGRVAGNNLGAGTEKILPRMEGFRGKMPTQGQGRVRKVPGNAALIVVEGRAGQGIDRCKSDNLNEQPNGYTQSVTLEAVIKAKLPDDAGGAAVVQAAGNIEIDSPHIVEITSTGKEDPGLRSKSEISVTNDRDMGTLSMPDGEVSTRSGTLNANYDSREISVSEEEASASLSRLAWDQVEKPDGNANSMRAGTYVIWEEGIYGSTEPGLRYYDMDYDEYLETVFEPYIYPGFPVPPALQGELLSGDFSEVRPNGEPLDTNIGIRDNMVTISGDLNILPTDSAEDFAIVPYGGTSMSPGDVSQWSPYNAPVPGTKQGTPRPIGPVRGKPPAQPTTLGINITNARIHGTGNLILKGAQIDLAGATLISEGDIRFNTGELNMKPGENNLSVYAKGDVSLSSFNITDQEFGEFKISGTLYSWGDLAIIQGDPTLPGRNWGVLDITGCLVAYGGDPTEAEPGNGGRMGGSVKIVGRDVKFDQDPTVMAAMVGGSKLADELRLVSVGRWTR